MESITGVTVPVPGYEGLYAITKNGVVFSLPRPSSKKLNIMNPVDNMKAGYLRVVLCKDGQTKLWYIHRLVALAFIPNPENKPMVNHKNGNKRDNRLENLEWVTSMENHTHAFEHGLYPQRKIHPSKRKEVYDLVKSGVHIKDVAAKYGLKTGGVYALYYRYKRNYDLRQAA
ncbi:NUMOD4 motif-containing HNH endonuclease [Geomonas subterranea]|uniref:NUMOD4 motif-containing HNH endonuclease n=1 Tax=Geomonas subterranea TaxID=2847989 RepID=A0ABX8LL40_9BACT|nr:NUMOD4 motif-containing HNH endonuclease [Geomonas subterranea]QXE92428.1 NUMOD4 motif-containing HNH endonuclease [Geomonas subterranea]QXM09473.1 NUMOD4 motif-containing HNH endonuclease [Geomonas subterranea]